jgi:hypothetical protein
MELGVSTKKLGDGNSRLERPSLRSGVNLLAPPRPARGHARKNGSPSIPPRASKTAVSI